MLFEFSVLLRYPSPLKCTKRHSKLRRSTATTFMTRWWFPLHWKLDARLSIPKTFTMARQLMDNSPFEIPSLDHPGSNPNCECGHPQFKTSVSTSLSLHLWFLSRKLCPIL